MCELRACKNDRFRPTQTWRDLQNTSRPVLAASRAAVIAVASAPTGALARLNPIVPRSSTRTKSRNRFFQLPLLKVRAHLQTSCVLRGNKEAARRGWLAMLQKRLNRRHEPDSATCGVGGRHAMLWAPPRASCVSRLYARKSAHRVCSTLIYSVVKVNAATTRRAAADRARADAHRHRTLSARARGAS